MLHAVLGMASHQACQPHHSLRARPPSCMPLLMQVKAAWLQHTCRLTCKLPLPTACMQCCACTPTARGFAWQAGRIAVYGDSNCLDSSHRRFSCQGLFLKLIKWVAEVSMLPSQVTTLAQMAAAAHGCRPARCWHAKCWHASGPVCSVC